MAIPATVLSKIYEVAFDDVRLFGEINASPTELQRQVTGSLEPDYATLAEIYDRYAAAYEFYSTLPDPRGPLCL